MKKHAQAQNPTFDHIQKNMTDQDRQILGEIMLEMKKLSQKTHHQNLQDVMGTFLKNLEHPNEGTMQYLRDANVSLSTSMSLLNDKIKELSPPVQGYISTIIAPSLKQYNSVFHK